MKYVEFNSVKIRNFLSIGTEPVEINFREGLNIITGVNKDKEDMEKNVPQVTVGTSGRIHDLIMRNIINT